MTEKNDRSAQAFDDKEGTELENISESTTEELNADEQEFRALRRDLAGVKGASGAGIIAISVGKTPGKNEFFRTDREFGPIVSVVNVKVGMEQRRFSSWPSATRGG